MRVTATRIAQLMGEVDSTLPPQQGYPEISRDWNDMIPEPMGYVYHVSPYAKEIMEGGFIIDPTKTTLGAFGELNSVSTTNYDNAVQYKDGIRIVVGVASGELSTRDLVYELGYSAVKSAINHIMSEEVLYLLSKIDMQSIMDEIMESEGRQISILEVNGIHKEKIQKMLPGYYNEVYRNSQEYYKSPEFVTRATKLFLDDLDFYDVPLSPDDALQRRWDFLKSASLVTNLPLVVGHTVPEHLKTRRMDDVGIVEVMVAPTEYAGNNRSPESVEKQVESIENTRRNMEESDDPVYTPEYIESYVEKKMSEIVDPKGHFTYTDSEQEWKFYDVTDLWPIRLVGNTMRVTATRIAQLMEEVDESVPPQDGYPTFQPADTRYPEFPEPVGYVYHVSPYAKEILEGGFVIDIGNSVLGGGSGSISTTNYENAVHYQENIKLTVGVMNGELSIKNLIDTIGYESCKIGIDFIMEQLLLQENVPLETFLPEKYMENYNKYLENYNIEKAKHDKFLAELKAKGRENVTKDELKMLSESGRSLPNPRNTFIESDDASEWFLFLVENDLDFYGNPIPEDQIEQKRWNLLKAISMVAPVPLIAGNNIPEHLKGRKMSDVGIVEFAVAPTKYDEGHPPTRQEDPKGTFSYLPQEEEWRFYDSTDLWPIRLVGKRSQRVTASKVAQEREHPYKTLTITAEDLVRALWDKPIEYSNTGEYEGTGIPWRKVPPDAELVLYYASAGGYLQDYDGGWIAERLGSTVGARDVRKILSFLGVDL